MIGSITPLVQEAIVRRRWIASAVIYTAGSVLAAATTGLLLGVLGHVIAAPQWAWWAVVAVAVIGLLTEFWQRLRPRPVVSRQTVQQWRWTRGELRAAFWWGADLGNGLTTTANYNSIWAFVLTAALLADPVVSAWFYCAYGLGRAALVWTGPLLRERARHLNVQIERALMEGGESWHRFHGALLVVATMIVIARL